MPSNSNASPPRCCCCRIDEAAKILAWISIVLLTMSFCLQIYQRQKAGTYVDEARRIYGIDIHNGQKTPYADETAFWINPICIVIYCLVLVGCYQRKSVYFLPYLIISGIGMIFGLIGVIYLIMTEPPFLAIMIILISYAINGWIYWVFFKAYKFIKEEQNGGLPNELPIFYQQPQQNPNAGGIVMMQHDQQRQYYPVQQKS